MVKANYELTLIFRPDVSKEKTDAIVEKIKKILKVAKGKIVTEEALKERKFIYPIKKLDKGLELFLAFTCDPGVPPKLIKDFKTEEEIIRFLLIKK